MRDRYFLHTITDVDLQPSGKNGRANFGRVKNTDNLMYIKLHGKPFVYRKELELKADDEVLVIIAGSVINTMGLTEGQIAKFDFLPKCRIIQFCQEHDKFHLTETRHGRKIRKEVFGIVWEDIKTDKGRVIQKTKGMASFGLLLGPGEYEFLDLEKHIMKYHDDKSLSRINEAVGRLHTMNRKLNKMVS